MNWLEDYYLLIVVLAIVIIIIHVAFANQMQKIADMKNAPFRVWAWCFWLAPLGIAIVISLPDRRRLIRDISENDELKSDESISDESEDVEKWSCPKCGKQNFYWIIKCDCGFEK